MVSETEIVMLEDIPKKLNLQGMESSRIKRP